MRRIAALERPNRDGIKRGRPDISILEKIGHLYLRPTLGAALVLSPPVHAEEGDISEREKQILKLVRDRKPEVKVDDLDKERLRVRRIDPAARAAPAGGRVGSARSRRR